jgi:virulence-associated protein VapD
MDFLFHVVTVFLGKLALDFLQGLLYTNSSSVKYLKITEAGLTIILRLVWIGNSIRWIHLPRFNTFSPLHNFILW